MSDDGHELHCGSGSQAMSTLSLCVASHSEACHDRPPRLVSARVSQGSMGVRRREKAHIEGRLLLKLSA
ncbi:hypothetical protein [Roseovarius sp. D0-M9]|uniref:hypothetical protein n=1 Tax=Roseovarius sp. D0-M9 TaxID=3127117 RepID=UPI0030101F86